MNNKKLYLTPKIRPLSVEHTSSILVSSVETVEKDFKAHSDNYETETLDWGTISFE